VTHSPCSFHRAAPTPHLPSFPTRRSSDLRAAAAPEDEPGTPPVAACARRGAPLRARVQPRTSPEAHPGERIAGGARDRPRAAERAAGAVRQRAGAARGAGRRDRPGPGDLRAACETDPRASEPVSTVRTRFAPSPSGSLHVGNARTAVLNWLFARHHGGAFILRVEDTDRERTVPGAEAAILEDLRWLGLEWDEGPGVEGPDEEGPYAPYRQSERGPIYREHADRLLEAGLAYPCFCTPEELGQKRLAAIARGEPARYDGACLRLTRAEIARYEREGRRPAIRFRTPVEGEVVIHDAVRGVVRVASAEIGDFIILRPDGVATYNFAVVVDDALMRITHVIRGVGHLSNTPRQAVLFDALGFERPIFAHTPTVLGPDRQKLSKRHGAKPLADYRREGYHPDALVNYLSLLGWSSPSGEEFLTRDRLINEISLDRIGAADVVFDPVKLRWLSSKHIERLPLSELAAAVDPFIDRERFPLAEDVVPVAVEAVR